MKKLILICCTLLLVSGCTSPYSRNKWQKLENNFSQRRKTYYNDFVENGGMIKDESTDNEVYSVKKEIQNSLNYGKTINQTL